ncbi:uncharacterized protein LOC131157978 [Malania oleifera]|uniref:uncharacterized protein LOC131157978 n=1 Tax=Malania oleifera TaxID=397392 RepID=UPI0025AE7A74|nr:uncharacterized protein LOC131157978 [Malania oleifera]
MAASSKFDLSSGSPDRPLYASGQRGPFAAASLDRSGSFRESMDNPILSALPSMSRSSSSVVQGDVTNFFQYLRFDPKLMAADHKVHRPGDLKRHISSALGVSPDDSPSTSSKGKLLPSPVPEELKRAKAGLRDSSNKAREHVKILNEALSTFKKYFPSIPSRKRSRSDALSSDRSNASLSGDRSVLGSSVGKMGSQSHAMTSGFDLEQQKTEERIKCSVPSKRTRTSLVDLKMDVRPNASARQSGAIDRDREMIRLANSGAVQGEDRTLSVSVDWEKSKMKKKRSGIKPDVSLGTVSTKPIEGYREPKQGLQQRLVTDARSRLNESHGFRPGVANGAVGVGKADGISQQICSGIRSSIPRTDQDNSSVLNDKRDRSVCSDKERVNVRAVNKTNVREDFSSASPTSNMKMNASVRAPRSGSGVVPKLSPVVHRAAASNDWEVSHRTNKLLVAVGANNRKRTPSTRSSSPPVAQWAGQRPQKISRTARRTNLLPIVSSNDENPALDTISDGAGNESSLGFARRLPNNSPQQVKFKGDHFSSAALSESEESGAAETKSREKVKKSDEIEEKAGQNVQKMSTLVLPSRKNKMVNGEDIGDNVRRQGRTARGFTSTRSLMPLSVEKLGSVGTAKQLRSAKLGLDKTESKAGRPPTRKLSDRKAYTRQKHTVINAAADFLVGSDDGQEELLAAANAVINSSHAFSSPFWRQMEPFFKCISDADITYLKQQVNRGLTTASVSMDVDGCGTPNGFGVECQRGIGFATDTKTTKSLSEQFIPGKKVDCPIPLCQRLMAAFISEEENIEFCCTGNEDLKFDAYGTGYELDAELESSCLNHQMTAGQGAFNGHRITANGSSFDKMEHNEPEKDMVTISNVGFISNSGQSLNGSHLDQALMPNIAYSEFQYNSMSLNERLLLELQSVGIFTELMPDVVLTEEEEISENISRLEDKYHEQVSKNKGLLSKLLKSASETRELQEKEFECRALDKLVGMAYEKYMNCWGPNASSGKSSSGKMAKQAALAFVKRTLERCKKFEDTGKSCFSEPIFGDMFLSGSSHLLDTQSGDMITEGESAKPYTNISGRTMEVRVSASMNSLQSPSLSSRVGHSIDNHDVYSSDAILSVNHSSEQSTGKEDIWSNRVKKRELLLDDVGGTAGTSSSIPPSMGSSLSSSTKGKRSERDREGKGHSREVLSRNGTAKIGRPALSTVKGERKSKAKPKQKMTQLSASVNGLIGKMSEPKPVLSSIPKSIEMATGSNTKGSNEFGLGVLDDSEAIDLSSLQLPGMDVLGVPDDLGEQGQDLGSWLNIDDDGLQDHDFMGLEIPMDDLSDLKMMV